MAYAFTASKATCSFNEPGLQRPQEYGNQIEAPNTFAQEPVLLSQSGGALFGVLSGRQGVWLFFMDICCQIEEVPSTAFSNKIPCGYLLGAAFCETGMCFFRGAQYVWR